MSVYVSAQHRTAAGRDEVDGARLALADAGGAVDGRSVVLRALRKLTPGRGRSRTRATAAATRVALDPDAIGYIGDHDSDATGFTLPILNAAGIAQVSPASDYGGLTRGGRISADPERYFPSGTRTFVRLFPADFVTAQGAATLAARHGARRVWLVADDSWMPSRRLVSRRQAPLHPRDQPRCAGTHDGAVAARPRRGAGNRSASPCEPLPRHIRPPPQLRRAAGLRVHGAAPRRDPPRRPGPDRDAVRDALFQTRERVSILGTYSVIATGDTTFTRHAAYRVGPRGRLVFAEALDALGRRTA